MLLSLCCAVIFAKGQIRNYGQVDIDDLRLTTCDFEKNASAMVLFDKTDVNATTDVTTIKRHRRIKILNQTGLGAADVTIEFTSKDHFEKITDVDAQTILLDNGTVRKIPVDKALIYKQTADKTTKTLKFSFPAVKPGAIVEFIYTRTIDFPGAMPDWNFQESLPVAYSSFDIKIGTGYGYKIDALPQGVSMTMPDKSISFKRIVSEQDGQILIRFNIDFAKSIFSVDEYPAIRDFYKKMFEMLNEQIVLKKI